VGSDPTGMTAQVLVETLESNEGRLLRFLAARTRDPELAKDLLQDARVKLLSDTADRDVADPLSYLYRMLENLVRDHRRSETSRTQRNQAWGDRGEGAEPLRADPVTPEQRSLDRDYLERVLAELDTLPERTKTIFLAYRVDGTSQKEIASDQGISLSAVEKHLQRAYRLVADVRKKFDAGSEQ